MCPQRKRRGRAGPPPPPPDAVMPRETTYRDLDRDGVPDAVQTSQTVGYDVSKNGVADVVETTEELASEIDIAGVPHQVEITQTVEADVHHDGELEVVDVASIKSERAAARRRGGARRRLRTGRTALARAPRRVLRRQATQGFAAARVRPDELLQALHHVTACSSALGGIRVSVDRDVIGVAVHSPEAQWWVAGAVRARLRRGAPTAVTVERAHLSDELGAVARTHRRGVPFVVRDGEAIWIGGRHVEVVTDAERQVLAPPNFAAWKSLEHDVVVPTVDDTEGETTFPFSRGSITATNSLLRAFTMSGVTRVGIFEAAGRVFLLGASGEERVANRIVIAGEGRVVYS